MAFGSLDAHRGARLLSLSLLSGIPAVTAPLLLCLAATYLRPQVLC